MALRPPTGCRLRGTYSSQLQQIRFFHSGASWGSLDIRTAILLLWQAAKEARNGPLTHLAIAHSHFSLTAPAPALLNSTCPYYLFIDERLGVPQVSQLNLLGPPIRLQLFLSKYPDPTTCGRQPFLRALAVAAELTQEAFKITHHFLDLGHSQVQAFCLLFLENPNFDLQPCSATLLPDPSFSDTLSPAQRLWRPYADSGLIF